MKKIMSLFLFVCVCVMMIGGNTAVYAEELCTPAGIAYDMIGEELDRYVKKYEEGLASCEVAVFDREGIITSRYYGYSDIENKIPADENMVYDWGSTSKLLVWVSVMQQVERGNIDLDTDIREYLPTGFLTKIQYEDEKITMVNLMNHNAGFQESFYENQACDKDALYDNLEDALRACECYQAYHVGEYTAYSNYGNALAAFVVECVSGMDYRDYVRENIFLPLGMEHTSIDPLMADNEYVREKRKELKCYGRYADAKDNKDYGVCYTWVQLYPAGSVIGTLDDFAKFGMALTSSDSVLFEKSTTWEEMVSPTSYYGDSDIAKNSHGFWTTECKVQVIGHAGNTTGCSAILDFDPVSGLGVVIMTNEPGETMFCYGIPNLLFGEITDRPEYAQGYIEDADDISGIYFAQRTIDSGAVSFQKYTGMIFPIRKNKEGSYDLAFGSLTIDPDNGLYKLDKNQYIIEKNGQKELMYFSKMDHGMSKFEMMSMDIITSKADMAKMLFVLFTIVVGLLSIMILIIKLFICVIRMIRKKKLGINRQIVITQFIYGTTLAVILGYVSVLVGGARWFVVLSAVLAALLGLISGTNGVYLLVNTVKDKELKRKTKINRVLWSLLSIMYLAFIITFQFYNFWAL